MRPLSNSAMAPGCASGASRLLNVSPGVFGTRQPEGLQADQGDGLRFDLPKGPRRHVGIAQPCLGLYRMAQHHMRQFVPRGSRQRLELPASGLTQHKPIAATALGCLLGLELRRVGSGARRTFADQEAALSDGTKRGDLSRGSWKPNCWDRSICC